MENLNTTQSEVISPPYIYGNCDAAADSIYKIKITV